jgi:DNA-binding NarL/FixJ family response regulator
MTCDYPFHVYLCWSSTPEDSGLTQTWLLRKNTPDTARIILFAADVYAIAVITLLEFAADRTAERPGAVEENSGNGRVESPA